MPGSGFTAQKCGALTRRGTACSQPAMRNGRCRMHGGKTPRGVESPHFSHGRYSKAIPDRLSARYEEAVADAERHDLRDEIALSEAKIDDLLAGIESRDESLAWKDVERWIARKTRTVEADVRIAATKGQMVSVEEMMGLIGLLLAAIRRHVADQGVRTALAREIRAATELLRPDHGEEEDA
jgi:hypothetical protein